MVWLGRSRCTRHCCRRFALLSSEIHEKYGSKNFIFTGAQNDAPIHEEFWVNLKAYAAYINAEIVVGPWTYETQWWAENNPTARASC